jgi:hypothetical protein
MSRRGVLRDRLPVEPLVVAAARRLAPVAERGGGFRVHPGSWNIGFVELLGPHMARLYHRSVQQGYVTVCSADRLAVALGYHPAELWPEWYDHV